MKHDHNIHHRRSIRLEGYDYSQTGAYFVTICAKDRECLFGDVVGGEMRLNRHGHIAANRGNGYPGNTAMLILMNGL
jgi:putative transposase